MNFVRYITIYEYIESEIHITPTVSQKNKSLNSELGYVEPKSSKLCWLHKRLSRTVYDPHSRTSWSKNDHAGQNSMNDTQRQYHI